MARVNVDQEFWSDHRFDYFASLVGEDTVPEHAKKLWLSRYRILLLWNHCYNKRTEKLNSKQVAYACMWSGDPAQLIDALVESDIVLVDGDDVIVKGIDCRIAYLKAQSDKGKKGGRPKKQKLLNAKAENSKRLSSGKALASNYQSLPLPLPLALSPALSPAPAQELNTPLPPFEGDIGQDEAEEKQNKTPSQENGKRIFNAHALVEMWNVAIDDGANFPRVAEATFRPGTKRYRAAEARAREVPDGDYWVDTLIRIMNSEFCNGKNDRKWRADFDFFVRPDSHIKINEGKYDDK